jgi:hypothetical protein
MMTLIATLMLLLVSLNIFMPCSDGEGGVSGIEFGLALTAAAPVSSLLSLFKRIQSLPPRLADHNFTREDFFFVGRLRKVGSSF